MNTSADKPAKVAMPDKKGSKKASTNELPMVDLAVVLDFVGKIEADGLQTLTAQEVAKRMNFASATSTPFYRRTVAAKLFGLLDTTQGVNLTKLALDFFKPTDDESKAAALATAMKNVVAYQKILERYSEKRLPQVDILANLIEREFALSSDAAKVCAGVFVNSAQRAGLVKDGGMLSMVLGQRSPSQLPPEKAATPYSNVLAAAASSDSESHFLTLDAKRGRRVVLQGPPIITESELKRIQNWLGVQFHVVNSLDELGTSENKAEETPS